MFRMTRPATPASAAPYIWRKIGFGHTVAFRRKLEGACDPSARQPDCLPNCRVRLIPPARGRGLLEIKADHQQPADLLYQQIAREPCAVVTHGTAVLGLAFGALASKPVNGRAKRFLFKKFANNRTASISSVNEKRPPRNSLDIVCAL